MDEANTQHDAGVAICGLGLRLPRGINTPSALFDFLLAGKDARGVPDTKRYEAKSFVYSDRDGQAHTLPSEGYWLDWDEITGWDAAPFSGISRAMSQAEVEKMDPQQRILLRVVWEALENACETQWLTDKAKAERIGCYVGSFGDDWREMRGRDPLDGPRHRLTGYGDFSLSNRVSNCFGFGGPSMTIRAACAAGGLALHLACQAIRAGECDTAIVAGSNIILSPEFSIFLAEHGVLSPDASCRTFDAKACGYARAEGVNCLVIKRPSLALKDRNPIRAVIRGSAVNANGRTAGMSKPSSEAQEALVRAAYRQAGIPERDMAKTAMVECHGTGTPVGDAVETYALAKIFGRHGVLIGSVKPSLGHSEAASALTSVMKAVLSLENRVILPNIKFENPNCQIPFHAGNLTVPTAPMPWPADRQRRIGVSSFGIGGTNVHIILDSAGSLGLKDLPPILREPKQDDPRTVSTIKVRPTILLVSAASRSSLARLMERYKVYSRNRPRELERLAHTLHHLRIKLTHRDYIVIDENGSVDPGKIRPTPGARSCTHRGLFTPIAFIFSGAGQEWARIGVELLKTYRTFSDDIKAMEDALQRLPIIDRPSWSIRGEMIKTRTRSRLQEPQIACTVLTAIQIALTNLLGRYCVRPSFAVGHSTGKYAADYASGLLSAEEAICLALYASKPPPKGRLAASKNILGIETCQGVEEPFGLPTKLDQKLAHDQVYGCPRVPSTAEFRQRLRDLLVKAPGSIHLVIGPESSVADHLEQMYAEERLNPTRVPTVTRGHSATITFLTALGELYIHGATIQLPVSDGMLEPLVDLDPYPWDLSKHFWPESRAAKSWRLRKHPPHELLGIRILDDCGTSPTWRSEISVETIPWLKDHRVGADIVLPAAAFVAMAGEASFQLTGEKNYVVKELSLKKALVLPPGLTVEVATSARSQSHQNSEPDAWEVFFASFQAGTWTTHCTGLVRSTTASDPRRAASLKMDTFEERDSFVRQVDHASWYTAMARVGYNYGRAFRGMRDITANVNCKSAKLRLSNDSSSTHSSLTLNSYAIHPTVLDNMIQSLIVASHAGQPRLLRQLSLPTFIQDFSVTSLNLESQNEKEFDIYAVATEHKGDGSCRGSLAASSVARTTDGLPAPESRPVALVNGLAFEPIILEQSDQSCHEEDPHGAMQVVWKQDIGFTRESLFIRGRAGPEHEHVQKLLGDLFFICAAEVRDATALALAAEMHDDPNRTHLLKLIQWLKEYPDGQDGQVSQGTGDMDCKKQMILKALRKTSASPAAELLSKCSSKANEIFNGTVSPLELFLEDNSLHRLYDWMNSLWSYESFFELLAHKYGRYLRVIEVGAGTGGLTARVLEHLRPRGADPDSQWNGRYVFTDVSSGFFPSAKTRFQDVSGMEYRVLDISSDPLAQGFRAEYDLVIASNVLHATPDLTQTLRHVRSLLKPDGRLLLQELACEFKWINLIMGFLPGWWLGESDGRVQEPYLDHQAWDERLRQASFKPLDTLVLDANPPYQMNATMIAEPETLRPGPQPIPQDSIVLLHDDLVGASLGIIEALEQSLQDGGLKFARRRIGSGAPGGTKSEHVVSLLDLSPSGPFLANISPAMLERFLSLLDGLQNSGSTLLWLTRACEVGPFDPSYAQILGFLRSVRKETGLHFVTLQLDSTCDEAMDAAVMVLKRSISDSCAHRPGGAGLGPDREFAYVSRAGGIVVPRFAWTSVSECWAGSQRLAGTSSKQRYLQVKNAGQLDSLCWVQALNAELDTTGPGPGMVEVSIEAAGLNFKDVLMAMGIESTRAGGGRLGCEAAGVVTAAGPCVSEVKLGDRVMLFAPDSGCLAGSVLVHEHHCVPIPDSLSFAEAAGMPCVYVSVLRALVDKANLKRGQTVLVHSAAGGVGIAAIHVARWLGASIYATVGNEQKAQFLHEQFLIPEENIFHSRHDSFQHDILAATGGRGVDVVLNSLSGQLLHASWRCVAPCGTFVELGKRDIVDRGKLAMEPLGENRSFVAVDMAHLAVHDTRQVSRLLRQVVHLYSSGAIRPVEPLRVYPYHDVTEAIRSLYTGTNIGKIVIDIAGNAGGQHGLATSRGIRHQARAPLPDAAFTPEHAYVLIGGLHGLSASIGRWMVCYGAKNIFFLSRSMQRSPVTNQEEGFVYELRGAGCTVTTMHCDVVDGASVQAAISAIAETHHIAGVIHLAGLLWDMETKHLTFDAWKTVTAPKVRGTWNLHLALTAYAPDLEFFVLASSIIGTTGNLGQANYAGANSFLDAFAQHRQGLGLACSVLDIGVVEDVGIMSHQPEKLQNMRRAGVRLLSEQDVLDGIQLAIARSKAKTTQSQNAMDSNANSSSGPALFRYTCEAQVAVGFSSVLPLHHPNTSVLWKDDARMASYDDQTRDARPSQHQSQDQASSGKGSAAAALGDFISRVSRDPTELDSPSCADFLANQIFRRVQSFLMRVGEVDRNLDCAMDDLSAASIGVDSLMTIEIRNWWRQTFGTSVSLLQLTSAPNFAHLGKLAARQLRERHITSPIKAQ